MSGRRSRRTRLAEWLGIERQPGGVTLVRARAVVLLLGLMLLLVAGLVALGDAYTDDVIRASLGFALVAILLGILAQRR
jgi:hypothetical protein